MNTLVLVLVAAMTGQVSWPGFLGAGATPLDPATLPLRWSPTENIAWQAPLPGHGQSSPVIHGDAVYLTAVEGPLKDTCHVLCLALADGRERWRRSVPSSDPVENSLYVSRAAPTPVVDDRGVYAFFESGDVVALTHDGAPRWQRSLAREFGRFRNRFGLAASPAQTEDRVFVLVDDEGPSYLLALAKADGATLWKRDRTSRTSWSSPAVVTIDGQPQVVVSSAGSVDAYDPATGASLWTLDGLGGNTAATPIDMGTGRFLVGASAGREGQNTEGARRSNLMLTATRQGTAWEPRVVWRTERATPSFGSPVVHGAQAYWVNRAGVVSCLDAATGDVHYEQRSAQSVWATPLCVGDRIYLFGKEGTTTVVAAGPEWKVLAENALWEPASVAVDPAAAARESTEERRRGAAMFGGRTQYGVAAVNGTLLVRTGDVLYCLRDAAQARP
jgi:outer membrane protein assembly factor BamB